MWYEARCFLTRRGVGVEPVTRAQVGHVRED